MIFFFSASLDLPIDVMVLEDHSDASFDTVSIYVIMNKVYENIQDTFNVSYFVDKVDFIWIKGKIERAMLKWDTLENREIDFFYIFFTGKIIIE